MHTMAGECYSGCWLKSLLRQQVQLTLKSCFVVVHLFCGYRCCCWQGLAACFRRVVRDEGPCLVASGFYSLVGLMISLSGIRISSSWLRVASIWFGFSLA